MVRRAPFPRSSLPANIELFNEANLCVSPDGSDLYPIVRLLVRSD